MPKKSNSRQAQGAGTIRQRKDGTWEARYTLGRDPGTGKQLQKSVYGKTQKEVLNKLQRVLTDVTDGTYIAPSKTTVEQWANIWHENYLGPVKPYTVTKYRSILDVHIIPHFGKTKLNALSAPMIQRFYRKCIEEGLSPKTVTLINGVFHKCLDKAIKLQYIKINPCDACELPRIKKPDLKPLHDEQVGLFLEAIKGNPLEVLFKFALFTGMRISEIIGLQWQCINLETGVVRVNKQFHRDPSNRTEFCFESLKNDKERIVTLPRSIIEMMKEHKKNQSVQRLKAGELWQNENNLIFTNDFGKHLYPNAIDRNVKKVFTDIGVPQMRFHDLRHSYATLALQNGDDLKTVSEALGHSSVAITADVYASVSQRMRQDSADRMEKYINSL